LSYGMYLLHISVIVLAWPWLRQLSIWGGFWSCSLITTAVAYLSYRFFEHPMNLWIRRRFISQATPIRAAR
jgi:peptidoglycan/LPS O-acetylase OafA/YrhL